MPFYLYEGIDRDGKKVKGQVEASGKNAALSRLIADGIMVSSVSDMAEKRRRFSLSLGRRSLADIFFQLSILLSSGIQLTKALSVTAQSVRDKKMKQALLDSCEKVSGGKRFSDSLEPHTAVFGELYIHLIKTSEKVGRLPQVLMDISRFEEERRKAGEKLTGAMIYPAVVLTLGLAVVGFMLAVVVPRLEGIFKSAGADIPMSTKMLLAVSGFIQHYGIFLFILFILGLASLGRIYASKGRMRQYADRRLYRLPFVQDITAARLSHVLSFQLKEGLPLVEALRNTAGSIGNVHVSSGIIDIAENVSAGKKFSESIERSGLFTELFTAACATGEKSGNLPELLERVNFYYARKTEQFTARFVSVIEPLFIMFIGIVVGFIVISIMEPLFSINTLVK